MRWLLCLLLVAGISQALAVIETYEFDSEVMEQRYHRFTEELRCPKCQNQNLSGSNSPIAADLRRELHRLLQEGKSDQEIVHYMVQRYGEFVLYRPPFDARTALLWVAPVVMLLVGGVVVLMIVRRQRKGLVSNAGPGLAAQEQQALNALLESEKTND